jgi:tartrate-resistant acid phosphatase type 5
MLQIQSNKRALVHAPRMSIRKIFTVAVAASNTGIFGRASASPIQSRGAQVPLLGALDVPEVNVSFTNRAVTFAAVGDFGQDGRDEERVANMIKSRKPMFIVTNGDNNYPKGEQATFDNNVAKHYHKFIKFDYRYRGEYSLRGSKDQRFFTADGNHDVMTRNGKPLHHSIELPGNRRFYNHRLGPVEIFIVNSNPSEPEGVHKKSHQAQWLKHELKHSKAKWKLVFMHHAPYSTGNHGSNIYMQWPYEKWGATAVLAGHDHFYERIVFKRVLFFVNGAGGAELDKRRQDTNIEGSDEDFAYDMRHGAMLMRADDQAIVFCFFNDNNKLIDAYLLPSCSHKAARHACESL